MLKQGLVKNGLEYARAKVPFDTDSFVQLIRECPSQMLLKALVEGKGPSERALPIGTVVRTLIEEDKFEMTIPFIQELQNTPSSGLNFMLYDNADNFSFLFLQQISFKHFLCK